MENNEIRAEKWRNCTRVNISELKLVVFGVTTVAKWPMYTEVRVKMA
jgi:hypothetical protein